VPATTRAALITTSIAEIRSYTCAATASTCSTRNLLQLQVLKRSNTADMSPKTPVEIRLLQEVRGALIEAPGRQCVAKVSREWAVMHGRCDGAKSPPTVDRAAMQFVLHQSRKRRMLIVVGDATVEVADETVYSRP
jgi:hypothetical protein